MIKYITSLIKKRETQEKRMQSRFEIVSEYPYVTIKMRRGFFFMLVRCVIVGQAQIRKVADQRTKLSKGVVDSMWDMHREATRMQEESQMNNQKWRKTKQN